MQGLGSLETDPSAGSEAPGSGLHSAEKERKKERKGTTLKTLNVSRYDSVFCGKMSPQWEVLIFCGGGVRITVKARLSTPGFCDGEHLSSQNVHHWFLITDSSRKRER